jgi:hypothetical protein
VEDERFAGARPAFASPFKRDSEPVMPGLF